MATINGTVTQMGDGSIVKVKWLTLTTTNDRGAPIPVAYAAWADRSIQILGTFGAGGTIVWQGSNDSGTTWATLADPNGNALSVTSAKIETVLELTELARPFISGGDGTTSLDVYCIMRRPNNMRS